MIICLDIGNTHIYGGIFDHDDIRLKFRYPSTQPCTSDTFGIFLQEVLAKNELAPSSIDAIVLCSVVPILEYSIVAACKKYFKITPLELRAGLKTGLKLAIKNPLELGADRVANAIAAMHHFPQRNLIVVDFGTATTICVIDQNKTYLGGAILPGIKLSMESLAEKAAKLPNVEIEMPASPLGTTTSEQLQSGVIYGQLGAIKEIIKRITRLRFHNNQPVIIGTGGYAHLLEQEKFFDIVIPDLVLHGLRLIWRKNT